MNREEAWIELERRAEERSVRLNDPCKHLTRCADMACNYRMADAAEREDLTRQSR